MTSFSKSGNASSFLESCDASGATLSKTGAQQYSEYVGELKKSSREYYPGDEVKRLFDLSVAILLLMIFAPLMLIIALCIKCSSRGPVFFKQRRHGRFGETFYIFKFRTMRQEEQPELVVPQARKNDPRVTGIGRILRRSSLDELPQLINVIKGEMSLVGPRPHAVYHDLVFSAQIEGYWERYSVRPGITGWAQINGLRGETETIHLMRQRVEYDRWYVQNRSVLLDLYILSATPTVFVGKRAY